jgi:hypothetical protein
MRLEKRVAMTLIDDLDRILEWHTRHRSPVAKLMRPGLSEDEILTRMSGLPFRLSREFIELHRWRDGVPAEGRADDLSFFEFHRFLPLDDVLTNFHTTYPIVKQFYDLTDWLMVFQDPAGDGYGLLGGPRQAEATPVTFLFEGEGVQIVFDSLSHMLRTVVAAFDQGVFTWSQNALQADYRRWGEVAHGLNPGIRYWRDYVSGGLG